jgi:hypothetical protein
MSVTFLIGDDGGVRFIADDATSIARNAAQAAAAAEAAGLH